jgi:hypothetical protein
MKTATKTIIQTWTEASDYAIQVCAKHLGYDELSDSYGDAIVANKLNKKQRDMLVIRLITDGYKGADVTNKNWIVPVKQIK